MKKKILVLGDSHALVFKSIKLSRNGMRCSFDVLDIGGATASGLENPNSKTNAYNIFNDAIENREYDLVIAMLGEVDTGFVIWYRHEKKQITLEESFNQTVGTYAAFLAKIRTPLLVISAPLATIRDGQDWGEIANLRKEVTASQRERTALTMKFNSDMEAICRKKGYKYLNLDDVVASRNGLLKAKYYSQDRADHHYDVRAFRKLLVKKLRKLL